MRYHSPLGETTPLVMKVAVFGDIHGFGPPTDTLTIDFVRRVVDRVEADVILQVGDMCFYEPFSRPVHWIYGNNDSPRVIQALERGEADIENLRNIKPGDQQRIDRVVRAFARRMRRFNK